MKISLRSDFCLVGLIVLILEMFLNDYFVKSVNSRESKIIIDRAC